MIRLFAANEEDFSTNGLLVLDKYCSAATVSEELNGEYSLELDIQMVDNDYANQVQAGMIISAPCPVREDYQLAQLELISTYTAKDKLYMYSKAKTSSKKLRTVKKGKKLFLVGTKDSGWLYMTTAGGKGGYVQSSQVNFKSTAAAGTGDAVITPELAKEQLFEVTEVEHTLEAVKVRAQHISYKLARNYVRELKIRKEAGAAAFERLLAGAMMEHEFEGYSDITKKATMDCSRKNPVECMFGEDLFGQYGGQFLRDNFNIYFLKKIGKNRGFSIAYRKNMTGMAVTVDTSEVVTRIVPIGQDKKGKDLYVTGYFVDSPRINDYPEPRIEERSYNDVKIGEDYANTTEARTELRARAAEEFEAGIDLPTVTVEVEFADLDDTAKELRGVYMGDEVRFRHESYGFDLPVSVVGYEWDALRKEYVGLSLGNPKIRLGQLRIDPDLIPSTRINDRMISPQSVGPAALGDESVSEDALQGESVSLGKLKESVGREIDIKSNPAVEAKENKSYYQGPPYPTDAVIGDKLVDNTVNPHRFFVMTESGWVEVGYDKTGLKTLISESPGEIRAAFGKLGGGNLIKNGNMAFGQTHWGQWGAHPILIEDKPADRGGGKRFVLRIPAGAEGHIYQDIKGVKANTAYTLSLFGRSSPYQIDIGMAYRNTTDDPWTYGPPMTMPASWYHYHSFTFATPANTALTRLNIKLNNTTSGEVDLSFGDVMLQEGENASPYEPHASEVRAGVTTLNEFGVKVEHTDMPGVYTHMAADGLRIVDGETFVGGLYKLPGMPKAALAATALVDPEPGEVYIQSGKYHQAFGLLFCRTDNPGVGHGGLYADLAYGMFMRVYLAGGFDDEAVLNIERWIGVTISAYEGIDIYSGKDIVISAGWDDDGSVIVDGRRLIPERDGEMNLGRGSNRWNAIYAKTSTINTSDLRDKKDIQSLGDEAVRFVLALNPVVYKWIESDSNRDHFGLIAQDVRDAMHQAGIEDFGGFIRAPKDGKAPYSADMPDDQMTLGVRYSEMIAPIISTVQWLARENEALKAEARGLKDQMEGLKTELELLTRRVDEMAD